METIIVSNKKMHQDKRKVSAKPQMIPTTVQTGYFVLTKCTLVFHGQPSLLTESWHVTECHIFQDDGQYDMGFQRCILEMSAD